MMGALNRISHSAKENVVFVFLFLQRQQLVVVVVTTTVKFNKGIAKMVVFGDETTKIEKQFAPVLFGIEKKI